MKKIEIKYIPIDDIKPYINNPRLNEEAIPYVMNSIKEFGFKNPIILDKNNVIVAGHTRLESAKRLDMKEVPVIYADDLTKEQIKAFRLADNKVSEKSIWDYTKLDEELENILDIDMSMFDFENIEETNLDDFFEDNDNKKEKESKLIECPHCHKPIEL
jgi:ParB-like chromosome segregation protein Spo0J